MPNPQVRRQRRDEMARPRKWKISSAALRLRKIASHLHSMMLVKPNIMP